MSGVELVAITQPDELMNPSAPAARRFTARKRPKTAVTLSDLDTYLPASSQDKHHDRRNDPPALAGIGCFCSGGKTSAWW
jgi:hypothetical protein